MLLSTARTLGSSAVILLRLASLFDFASSLARFSVSLWASPLHNMSFHWLGHVPVHLGKQSCPEIVPYLTDTFVFVKLCDALHESHLRLLIVSCFSLR